MLKTILLVPLLCVLLPAFTQENFITGYLISKTGDTLRGELDYRNWEVNPDRIRFREAGEEVTRKYTALDITGFGVKGEVYRGAVVDIETSPFRLDELEPAGEFNITGDTVFLQVLFDGEKSLFLNRKKYTRDNFYISRGGGFELLLYKEYIGRTDIGRHYLKKKNSYIGQLKEYLSDVPVIFDDIDRCQYRSQDLERLFQTYYAEKEMSPAFRRNADKLTWVFGIAGGGTLSTIKLNSSGYYWFDKAAFNWSPYGAVAVSADLVLPRNQGSWSLHNEILVNHYKVSGIYESSYNPTVTYRYVYDLGATYISLVNMARYTYRGRNRFVYVNGGVSTGFLAEHTNLYTYATITELNTNIVEADAIPYTKNFELAWMAGLGVGSGRIAFELRYERGDGMSKTMDVTMLTDRYYCLLAYRF